MTDKAIEQEIIFGAAYYAEYMPYERIDIDFTMMKKAGMNTVRIAESTWSTLEPEDGIFDFTYIDKMLDAAQRIGLHVIIGTPTYAAPAWMVQKEPAVMAVQKAGRALYGRRQLMDICNPGFLFYAERVIRKLAEHTAGHPSVIGFQIDNETKHYDIYSEGVQKAFVKHLKEKYKTAERLNQTFCLAYWSNSIHDWEDFPDMRGCIHGGLAGEYDAFRRNLVTGYLSWQADIVREYAGKGQFVTHNLDFEWKKFGADIAQDGYSYGVQPDACHHEIAELLDIAGTDIYHPTQDALSGAEIAFGGDEIRALKGKPYLVLENQAQAFKYWTPYPGQLRLHAYSHLASGAMGTMYWNWHSIHNGYETYWKGMLSHDLQENPVYREAAVFGSEWKRLGADQLVIRKKNQTAIVVDNQSLTALKWFPIDRDLSYNDVVRYLYDSLYEMNVECDVVFADALEPEKYQLIFIPALYCAEESLLNKLDKFVENGGTLFASFRSFVADKSSSVYADRQPHILHKCFGVSYQQFTDPDRTTVEGHPVSYWADLLCADTAEILAYYEHPYWKDYAAITRNQYGKGHAYYFGCYTSKDLLKQMMAKAVQSAGIPLPPAAFPLIIRSGVTRENKTLHYIMNYSSTPGQLCCPYNKSIDLLTNQTYHKDDQIHLNDWSLAVLQEN